MRIERAAALAGLLIAAGPVHASPFPTRDQNPLLAGFGLPTALPSSIPDDGPWSFAIDFNWSSTALVQAHGGEALIVDAETRETRLRISRSITDRFALQVQVPWRDTSAGSLDGFIDDWHDFFGLPEGARPDLPEDQLRIAYSRDGATLMDAYSSRSGLGDVSVDAGYELHSTSSSSVTAWLMLELPVGDAAKLNGNEALDASLALASEHRFGERWSLFAQAGATWLGEGELMREQQRSVVWSGMAGVGWRAFQPLEFKVQLDGHTAAFDSDLHFLNESLILTVGGALHLGAGWRIDLAVSEDIAVESAPDVVFVIGVRRN